MADAPTTTTVTVEIPLYVQDPEGNFREVARASTSVDLTIAYGSKPAAVSARCPRCSREGRDGISAACALYGHEAT